MGLLPVVILPGMFADFKVAFRAPVRQPVLSIVALATLVLGIGANTAIFSLVKGVLLDSLPYEASPPTYVDWKARTSAARSGPSIRTRLSTT